ncbi:peptidoglycan DD-metalloendopeptidase family protein [Campylobacter sp. FMV-PI01]|uniref:Peptidoglycan DD-metalloendopeptidase family protein n=1 Tax=Campylobacter portucalensis TaxID=2608384 RepID=A0A6L5WJ48_9BACT|nr:peptidoglycan DD-metalloendopeptidase family protein [Campylobacter portucalensis]MSN96492.1 peptidoglycan DD-metalloendopeptidase family protein [Campylobacter portucalensis]
MKNLVFIFIITTFLFSAQKTTKEKINQTQNSIQTQNKQAKKLSKKIDELANLIIAESKEVEQRAKNIEQISNIVVNLRQKLSEQEAELKNLLEQSRNLLNLQKKIEDEMIDLIVDEVAFNLLKQNEVSNSQNLVLNEIFNSLSLAVKDEMNKISNKWEDSQKILSQTNIKINQIQSNLKEYNAKKDELSKEKNLHEKNVKDLKKNREIYIKKLELAQKESDELRKTLQELKILDDKEERQKAIEKEKLANKQKEQNASKHKVSQNTEEIDQEVKLYGSSYQEGRVKTYKGSKTISPLKDAYVKRSFGSYNDPVYNIKIFNESITLASHSDNTVYNVLPGKVIFAKQTSVLDKVIIVENSGGMHTIYAHLSQIAPTIEVGSVIKKGYIIGKIDDDLTFEVTQKNYHINPLELISIK